MAIRRRKVLTTVLEVLLYIILATGIVFYLVVLDMPSSFVAGKEIFIISHEILGYIFWILVLWHGLINRKWYKAWFSGKIKNTKKSLLTKAISVLFLLMTISFFFEDTLPHGIYALWHTTIGVGWITLMICHIKVKRNAAKRRVS